MWPRIAYVIVVVAVTTLSCQGGCSCELTSRHHQSREEIEAIMLHREQQSADRVARLASKVGLDGWFIRVLPDGPELAGRKDTWGHLYDVVYERNGDVETVVLWSRGPDGVAGTEDDVSSHVYEISNTDTLAEIAKQQSLAAENIKTKMKLRPTSRTP